MQHNSHEWNDIQPLGSVKDHLDSIYGVEASGIEIMLDGISPSSYGATSWSFPVMNVWFEVINYSYWIEEEISETRIIVDFSQRKAHEWEYLKGVRRPTICEHFSVVCTKTLIIR